MGAIALGVGCLGFLPVSQSVSGEAQITSTPTARQMVTMPMSGRVKEVLVRTNQLVEPNQPLAILVSEELEQDVAQATKDYESAQSQMALTQQQLAPLQARYKEAQEALSAATQKTQFLQQQLTGLSEGNPPPQIQELESGQAGLRSDIIGLQNELELVQLRHSRYQVAFGAGAISRNEVEELERQQNTLRRLVREKTHQIEAKAAQINTVKQNLEQSLQQQQAEVEQALAAVHSASELVKQTHANVQIQQQLAMKMGTELMRQQARHKELLLRTTTAGTVVSADLDLLPSQFLPAGSQVLQVVDLHQLTTTVQIRPEDAPLVKPGASVTFRPQGTGLLSYTGTVQAVNIDPVVSGDGVQQPPSVTVRVGLNQGDNLLRPGLKGYAHIQAESVHLYQKLHREFVQLVPLGKYF